MSFITKRGSEAMEAAGEESVDYSDILKPFSSGKSYNVRVPDPIAFVEYNAHSVYKVFYTTPCTSASGEKDLYCKATDMLFNDAKKAKEAGNDEQDEELRDLAHQLKKRPRYMIGFFSLETGEPIIIDVTKNQADAITDVMKKRKNRLNDYAFNVSKTGKGQSTKVALELILDPEEELEAEEQKHFKATEGKEFDEGLFEKVLSVAGEEQQIKDLEAFGFDVTRLGVESTKDEETGEQESEDNADNAQGQTAEEGTTGAEDEDLGF